MLFLSLWAWYLLLEPFNVSLFAIDEFRIANPPYGSFMHYPSGFRARRWFAHECFILVYITVAQLFGSTHWMYCIIIKCCLFHSASSYSVSLSYVLCPFKFAFVLLCISFHENNIIQSKHITVTLNPWLFFFLFQLALLTAVIFVLLNDSHNVTVDKNRHNIV